jgi:TonB family protein
MRIALGLGVILLGAGFVWGQDAPSGSPSIKQVADTSISAGTRIPSGVMAARILTHPTPVYPKDAKKKHIFGMVVLHAIIGTDGRIENLTVLSGPVELQTSAVDAVKQWTYLPYELNGQPVKVDTTVTVNYNFGPAATLSHNGTMLTDGNETVELAPNAHELQGAKKVSPHYPAEAKQKHVTGDVTVSVLIGLDGHVESVDVVSGPELLRDAAVEAVRQWVYPQYAVDGVGKRVHTLATVMFRMSS